MNVLKDLKREENIQIKFGITSISKILLLSKTKSIYRKNTYQDVVLYSTYTLKYFSKNLFLAC